MKINLENYESLGLNESEERLLGSLLIDLEEINQNLENAGQKYGKLYIDYQDYHDEYSSERTDPCPDYFGYYRLYCEKDPYNNIGLEMTLDDLDSALCLLCNFIEIELS